MLPLVLSLLLQPFQRLAPPGPDAFSAKTIIITGGNTGIGFELARHAINLGASKVIIGVRDMAKGEAARENIEANTSRRVLEVWHLNMSNFGSVKQFAARARTLPSIDRLFLNAGVAKLKYGLDLEGWERTLQVNVLATALLGLLLLPKLVATARASPDAEDVPHMIISSSGLHAVTPFPERKEARILRKLNEQRNFEGKSDTLEQYYISKLIDVYISKELARLVPYLDEQRTRHAVIVNSVDPGLCKSELQRDGPPLPLKLMLKLVGRTPEVGSRVVLYAALTGEEGHGVYVHNNKIEQKPGALVMNDEGKQAQEKVWAEILEVLVEVDPSVREVYEGAL